MKKFFLICLAVLGVSACGDPDAAAATSTIEIRTSSGEVHPFKIELALTPQEQAQGLMNRTSMAENAGMLFVFGDEAPRAFWMKNTLIPLDMIFIRKDGTIHHIHENAIPHDLTSVPSEGPVSAVLEINGGLTTKLGIAKGDTVRHVLFGN